MKNSVKMLKKVIKMKRRVDLSRPEKFSIRFQVTTKVCKHLSRIISIRRNKRHRLTTHGWDLIAGNVRYERFFTFFWCSEWFRPRFFTNSDFKSAIFKKKMEV